jgi:hypothetical protein
MCQLLLRWKCADYCWSGNVLIIDELEMWFIIEKEMCGLLLRWKCLDYFWEGNILKIIEVKICGILLRIKCVYYSISELEMYGLLLIWKCEDSIEMKSWLLLKCKEVCYLYVCYCMYVCYVRLSEFLTSQKCVLSLIESVRIIVERKIAWIIVKKE